LKSSPIVLFVYNRPIHTKKTLDALKKCPESKDSVLYIFSDGSKNKESEKKIKTVRKIIKNVKGFKKVIVNESKLNKGLSQSIIEGVTKIINKHGRVIVLEDDLIVSKAFLTYMNYQLDNYIKCNKIFSISGYRPPINTQNKKLIIRRMSSWGWATWKNRWNKGAWSKKDTSIALLNPITFFKLLVTGPDLLPTYILFFFKKINVWAVRWQISQLKYNSFTIYPSVSYLSNIGHDLTGSHSKETNVFNTKVNANFSSEDMLKPIKSFEFSIKYWFFFFKNSSSITFFKKLFK
jgi:hypothetical protein